MKKTTIKEDKLAGAAQSKIAVLGGDSREIMVMEALLRQGWQVAVYGRPAGCLPAGAIACAQAAEALAGAKAVILPAPPVRDGGRLFNAEGIEITIELRDFAQLAPGTPVLAGVISPFLRQAGAEYRLELIETLELDEIALPFAIATAEGAIALALSANDDVLDQGRALILGYGRIGRALAARLSGLSMEVVVANRGAQRLAQAAQDDFTTVSWPGWPQAAARSDFIFNTAPHLLLDAKILPLLSRETVIIDLAATPGGVDFTLAKNLGLQAILASGLPGKYAPRFAGAVMAEFYPRLIELSCAEQADEGGN